MTIQKDMESGMITSQDEKKQPLISRNVDEHEYGDDNRGESVFLSLLSAGVAVWGSFQCGTCIGYSSPTQSGIREELGLSISQISLFGSILTIGAMAGAATCGPIADYIGRKGAMRLSSLICLLGWLAISLSQGALLLDVGRFSTGYGVGILSYVVPVFIAEISPINLRGGLTILCQIMLCAGISAAYIIGTFVDWRKLTLTGIVPSIILLIGLFFVPESPRWLAKMGYQEKFHSALRILRGKDANISVELMEIQEYNERLQKLPQATWSDLFQKKYSRAIIIGVGLMVLQQFGGINGVLFFASELFVEAGFSSGSVANITLGSIQVPFTIIGASLMDKSGRRLLLMVSASGTFLGTFIAGLSFYLKGQGLILDSAPMLALFGIMVYMGSYSIGVGGIPWVMMSEVFPINIKGTGGSLVTLSNWFCSWIVSYSFNFIMGWSSSGTLFIFSVVSLLTVLFVAKVVPETKGRTLEEIQASLSS